MLPQKSGSRFSNSGEWTKKELAMGTPISSEHIANMDFVVEYLRHSVLEEDRALAAKSIETIAGVVKMLKPDLKYITRLVTFISIPLSLSVEERSACDVALAINWRTEHMTILVDCGRQVLALNRAGCFMLFARHENHLHLFGYDTQVVTWQTYRFSTLMAALKRVHGETITEREKYLAAMKRRHAKLDAIMAIVNQHTPAKEIR